MPTNTYVRYTNEEYADLVNFYQLLSDVCPNRHMAAISTVATDNKVMRGMFLLGRIGVQPYHTVKQALERMSVSEHPDIISVLEYTALGESE